MSAKTMSFQLVSTIVFSISTSEDQLLPAYTSVRLGTHTARKSRRTTRIFAMLMVDSTTWWLIAMPLLKLKCTSMLELSRNSCSCLMEWKWKDKLDTISICSRIIWRRYRTYILTRQTTTETLAISGSVSTIPSTDGSLMLMLIAMLFKSRSKTNPTSTEDQEPYDRIKQK